MINRLGTVLNNLAPRAANNAMVLQELMASNLALAMLVTMLTATNKKLAVFLSKANLVCPPTTMPETPGVALSMVARSTNLPYLGN